MGQTIPGYWSHIAAAITFSSLVHVVLPDKLLFSKEMKAYALSKNFAPIASFLMLRTKRVNKSIAFAITSESFA